MELNAAKQVAEWFMDVMRPVCERIEIAGSVRRQKQDVGDVEIVCIPKTFPAERTLFGDSLLDQPRRDPDFASLIREQCIEGHLTICKGDLRNGKYVQLRHRPTELQIDLFTTTKENWGLIFAMRTGSAEFSHQVLAKGWVKKGFHSVEGMLMRHSQPVPVPEEEDLFRLIGVPWVDPVLRS